MTSKEKPMSHPLVAEIVTFKLLKDTDPADFVRAAQALETVLTASGKVLGRTLSLGADGQWSDHIIWSDLQSAKDMADKIMSDPIAAPMMAMIDPASAVMRHADIHYVQGQHAP